jgi:hypothetical protein
MRADVRIALAILFGCGAIFLLTASGHPYAADEETMIYVTAGILRRDDFSVPPPGEAPTLGMLRAPDGKFYSQTGLGPSLVAAPLFGLGEAFSKLAPARFNGFWTRFGVVTFLNPLVSAMTAMLLFCFCRWLNYNRAASVLTALAFGFATINWWFTKTAFTEPLAALTLLLSFAGLYRFSRARSYAWLAVSGLMFGLALLARFQLLVTLPLFGVYLLLSLWDDVKERNYRRAVGPLLLWCAPIVATLLLIGWYNQVRFGSPLESGYSPYAALLGLPRPEWIYGLVASPGKGMFWYSPPLIASLAGAWWFGKKFPREFFLIATFALSQVLFYGGYVFWHGDSGWGPRFLLPTIPFLMLLFAETVSHARARWLAYVTLVLGVIVQLPSVVVNTSTVVLLAPVEKPWDTIWMTDWASAPLVANWRLLWERLTMPGGIVPPLPPLPNDRFIWFNEPSIPHRADLWLWYLPATQMEGTAVPLVMGVLGAVVVGCAVYAVAQRRRIIDN